METDPSKPPQAVPAVTLQGGSLFVRGVDFDTIKHMKTAARARGMVMGTYVTALYKLHEEIRHEADGGNDELQKLLRKLGIESVSV